MSTLKKLSIIFLAFILVLSGLGFTAKTAAAAPAAATDACTRYHTVKSGETLYKIGLAYGVTWTTLAKWNNISKPGLIFTGQVLCVSKTGSGTVPQPVTDIPTFKILSVVRDKTVTIQTANFPANDAFKVLMGAFGTRGVNGIRVDKIETGKGGTFKATFNIPADLKGAYRIAIRLESPTSGYFAYNWFYNNTTGSGTGTGDGTSVGGYTGYPTFSISSVVRNSTVTIRTNNVPANTKFNVLMGKMGTRGVNGIFVTSFNSGEGGSFNATYNIPAELRGLRQIAIRLESPTTGYFAYNWFYNNTAN